MNIKYNKKERDCKICVKRSKDAISKHNNGKIKLEKAMKTVKQCIERCGIDPLVWNMAEQKELTGFLNLEKKLLHPYDDGNNETRESGFKHNPYNTVKGKFFQQTIKKTIMKSLQLTEWGIINKYDKDAFVYDDTRLKRIDEFTEDYINKHFVFREYQSEVMHQLRHIVYFIAKEDPYYTNAFFDFINKFTAEFKDGFELTEKEQETFDKWHVGDHEEVNRKYREHRKGKL